MKNNSPDLIAKNTMILYIRMIFTMLISLYTSRVVLQTLGIEDYGIYNVVGGLVMMFSLVSDALSSSIGRFLTFYLGKGDVDMLKKFFSTSFLLHLTLCFVVLILAETLGLWFLNSKMVIPEDRLMAANWVYQASVFSFILGLLSVTYNATIVAHEKMSAFAYIGILDAVLRLLIVLFLAYSPWPFDRLIAYSLMLVSVSFCLQLIYVRYCNVNFAESHLKFVIYKSCWRDLSSFVGWNFIGCSAGLLKDQGVNVLLNIFGGPVFNAARGVANSVNIALMSFANNFMTALNPQIIKSYALGDFVYMTSLVEKGAKFSFYIYYMFALPLIMETNFILKLWLGEFPEHTINFVRLVLILTLIEILSKTLITLQTATGKIKYYQIIVGGVLLLSFPFSYVILLLGYEPEYTYVVAMIFGILCLSLRLEFLHHMAGLIIKSFIRNVIFKICTVIVVSVLIPLFFLYNMEEGWLRFIVVCVLCIMSVICTTYNIGCSKNERLYIKSKLNYLILKIKKNLTN